MAKLLSTIFSYLMSFAVFAADQPKDAPIPESIDVTSITVFAVLFFGLCGYYAWYVYKQEMKRKARESSGQDSNQAKPQ